MKLLSRRTLRLFWEIHSDAQEALQTWARVVEHARWETPIDVKRIYGSADILKSGRVVFDIGGNKYRLVVAIKYRSKRGRGVVYVRFIGTHADYDKIDADEV